MNLRKTLEELRNMTTINELFITDPTYTHGIISVVVLKIHTLDAKGMESSEPYWIPLCEGECMRMQGRPVVIRGIKPSSVKRLARMDIFLNRDNEIIAEGEFYELSDWLSRESRMKNQSDNELDTLKKRVKILEDALGFNDYGREEKRCTRYDDFQIPTRIRDCIIDAYF